MRCRAYSPADREACLEVFDTNVSPFFRSAEREQFAAFLDDLPGPYYLLADESDIAVACGGYAVREDAGTADLCWGMVRRELHGHGIGRTLTELRIERIRRDRGVRTIALSTSQLTVGFYEGLGFRVVSVEPDGYGPGLDRCEMKLEVSGLPHGAPHDRLADELGAADP